MEWAKGNAPGTWQLTHSERTAFTTVLTLHVAEALGKLDCFTEFFSSNKTHSYRSLIYVCIRWKSSRHLCIKL